MANSKAHQQKLALELYLLHEGNISEVARDKRMPSRVTLQAWKKAGHPKTMTKGVDWETYRLEQDDIKQKRVQVKRATEANDFLDEAQEAIKEVFRQIKISIDAGDFEAKPADLEKMLKLYLTLDQREQEQQVWMQTVMVKILTLIADVVSPEQFTLIRQKFLDMERNESAKLNLVVDNGVPSLPTAEEMQSSEPEVEYASFTETS